MMGNGVRSAWECVLRVGRWVWGGEDPHSGAPAPHRMPLGGVVFPSPEWGSSFSSHVEDLHEVSPWEAV